MLKKKKHPPKNSAAIEKHISGSAAAAQMNQHAFSHLSETVPHTPLLRIVCAVPAPTRLFAVTSQDGALVVLRGPRSTFHQTE